jgi:RNA polymerase sigma factor (TIGR02999 family)
MAVKIVTFCAVPEGCGMATLSSEQITDLLVLWNQGDDHARDKLIAIVYKDLRRMAARRLQDERSGHTLQPTALANEAFLKLDASAKVPWKNRTHFYAVAARAIRQVLVDYARRRRRDKRGGEIDFVQLDEALAFVPERSAELLALDEALDRLAAHEPRKARVVELRFFGGLSNQEIAEVLEISSNTVIRDWDYGKAWLQREIRR